MKLTDKDLLEDAVQGAINIMEANGINMISASVPLAIIKGAPTVEAIPVEWLREQCKVFDSMARGGHQSAWIIKALIIQWQEEQEASE